MQKCKNDQLPSARQEDRVSAFLRQGTNTQMEHTTHPAEILQAGFSLVVLVVDEDEHDTPIMLLLKDPACTPSTVIKRSVMQVLGIPQGAAPAGDSVFTLLPTATEFTLPSTLYLSPITIHVSPASLVPTYASPLRPLGEDKLFVVDCAVRDILNGRLTLQVLSSDRVSQEKLQTIMHTMTEVRDALSDNGYRNSDGWTVAAGIGPGQMEDVYFVAGGRSRLPPDERAHHAISCSQLFTAFRQQTQKSTWLLDTHYKAEGGVTEQIEDLERLVETLEKSLAKLSSLSSLSTIITETKVEEENPPPDAGLTSQNKAQVSHCIYRRPA